jgi:hypothetical protein
MALTQVPTGMLAPTGVTAGSYTLSSITVDASGRVTAASSGTVPNGLTAGTAQNTTSGTAIDFTGIPSWVKRLTVMFNNVSTNGTSSVQVQLGTSSGITSSGYNSVASYYISAGSFITSTSAFAMDPSNVATAAVSRNGVMTIVSMGSNTWSESGTIYQITTGIASNCAGGVTLPGTLDRVRITTVNGTDAFDAGSINILYE